MTDERLSTQQAAARLLAALEDTSTLTHAQAEAQLPALVEAEFAGVNVDTQPEFAALLQHLAHCTDCMELYVELSEGLLALAGEAETMPNAVPALPTFFKPQRTSASVVLRVLGALQRQFELVLVPPSLTAGLATLDQTERINLFSDTLSELPDALFVAATLNVRGQQADLLVAISDAASTSWQVQIAAGELARSATTDAQGIARFLDLPIASLQSLTVQCAELPTV